MSNLDGPDEQQDSVQALSAKFTRLLYELPSLGAAQL
jgi:hypothetical protein